MKTLAIWTNYHSHCNFCDGKFGMEEYIERAIDKNMLAYGISSHAPLPFQSNWAMRQDKLPAYLKSINGLRQQYADFIQIYKGLEMDYIPGVTSPNSFNKKGLGLDYIIGSVHFCGQFDDGRFWEIDGPYSHFLEGLEKIYHGNIKNVIGKYFELTREMVANCKPDIVGHLDKIKIQNKESEHFSEYSKYYQEEVEKTLVAIKESGSIVEVNTRGLYKRLVHQPYPSRWVLEKLHEYNIPITINSDCHHPEEITKMFEETAYLLKTIGFETVRVLYNRGWVDVEFDSNGLLSTEEISFEGSI